MIRSTRYLPLLALLACAGGDPEPEAVVISAEPAPPADSTPVGAGDTGEEDLTPAQWTAGIVSVDHPVTGAALLTDVRVGDNEGFDRMVLEFHGDEMPSYHIEYIDRPVRECGSGATVQLAGDAWLAVRLEPANAHTEEGQPTITDRVMSPALPVLLELRITCDFEAQVEWVLGVASPNRFRVMELADPTRLIVDVRH
jgi:hypothetical protein